MSLEMRLRRKRKGESKRIRRQLNEAAAWALTVCRVVREERANPRTLARVRRQVHFMMGKLVI